MSERTYNLVHAIAAHPALEAHDILWQLAQLPTVNPDEGDTEFLYRQGEQLIEMITKARQHFQMPGFDVPSHTWDWDTEEANGYYADVEDDGSRSDKWIATEPA